MHLHLRLIYAQVSRLVIAADIDNIRFPFMDSKMHVLYIYRNCL